jgi:hypothetical protein
MNQRIILKTLVVAVIILFIGVGIQPAIAIVEPKEEIIDVEPKDYMFQTIIDIANNPEVKNLLEQYDNDLFKVDIDRSVCRKILLRNPRLFRSLMFLKPSVSFENLEYIYNLGLEIIDTIGEDKAIEIFESIEYNDIELFYESNKIISNDAELSNRLETMNEINSKYDRFWTFPIFCLILVTINIPIVIFSVTIASIGNGIFYIGHNLLGLTNNNTLFRIVILILGFLGLTPLLITAVSFVIYIFLCEPDLWPFHPYLNIKKNCNFS